jgi:hypothetical protein
LEAAITNNIEFSRKDFSGSGFPALKSVDVDK